MEKEEKILNENDCSNKEEFKDEGNILNYNNLSSNKKNKNSTHNNNNFLSNNSFQNIINEQETNHETYSFKPKKQETPNFLTKDKIIIVSDFQLINNENNSSEKINNEPSVFVEILKTKIEIDENLEEKQNKYLEEIEEKKRIKQMKIEMEKRCKNLRESIEMKRKKILENLKKWKLLKNFLCIISKFYYLLIIIVFNKDIHAQIYAITIIVVIINKLSSVKNIFIEYILMVDSISNSSLLYKNIIQFSHFFILKYK